MLLGLIWKLDKIYHRARIFISIECSQYYSEPVHTQDSYRRTKAWLGTGKIYYCHNPGGIKIRSASAPGLCQRQDSLHQAMLNAKFPMEFAKKVMSIDYANLKMPRFWI